MRIGPDIALVASLIGDPARANMLAALMSGQALTAGELAREAGVTLPTASFHIAKLEAGGLVVPRRQGRHRYVSLAGPDVAAALEALMGLAAGASPRRTRPGPKEPALREARICYDHLAGELGVRLFDRLEETGLLGTTEGTAVLTPAGATALAGFGLPPEALRPSARPPQCRPCLDWSVRRFHLGGVLGRALLARFFELGWATREPGTRIVRFSPEGRRRFEGWLAGLAP